MTTVVAQCPADSGTADLAGQYRELLSAGLVVVQGCRTCGSAAFPPTVRCRRCNVGQLEWWDAGHRGSVIGWTTVFTGSTATVAVPRQLLGLVPYHTVVFETAEYPSVRMLCIVSGGQQLSPGAEVTIETRCVDKWWLLMGYPA